MRGRDQNSRINKTLQESRRHCEERKIGVGLWKNNIYIYILNVLFNSIKTNILKSQILDRTGGIAEHVLAPSNGKIKFNEDLVKSDKSNIHLFSN